MSISRTVPFSLPVKGDDDTIPLTPGLNYLETLPQYAPNWFPGAPCAPGAVPFVQIPPLVTTVSAAAIIHELLRLSFEGGQPISYPAAVTSTLLRFQIGGAQLHVTVGQLAVMAVAIVLVIGLTLIVRWTWMGRSIRSVADSEPVSRLLGVKVNLISAQTVGLASALAGAAGVLLGLTIPAIDPNFGDPLQFKALAVALFGGLGSLPGAVLGGLLLGLIEAFAAGYLETSYRDLFAFIAMIIILFLRPAGLLGRNVSQRV